MIRPAAAELSGNEGATETSPMVLVDGVRKSFGARVVLDGVTARFERGQVSALVGPSGGGKSTLLRCLNGLERFDAGRVTVAGHELGPPGPRPDEEREVLRAIRAKAGMVFQQYGLFSHKSALENVVEAPVHVSGLTPSAAEALAMALLERVGVLHRKDAFPRELSGGEQQRVAIARALAMRPEVLLLDEPTSALDPDRKSEVVGLLRELARAGTTMIIVTHEPAIVRDIAEYAVLLRDGRAVAAGKPDDVLVD